MPMKKNMKWTMMAVSLILVLALAMPLYAGGQKDTAGPVAAGSGEIIEYGLKGGKPYAGTTLTLMLNNAAKNNAVEARIAEFTELTGINVEFDMTPFGSLLEKITAEGVGMTGTYDIVTYLDSWGPSIKQFLIPLDGKIAETGIDMNIYPPAFQQAVTYDGQIFGFPWRGHPQLLFYREDLLKQVGMGVPTTWKELEDVAVAITKETGVYGMSKHYASHAGQNLFGWITYLWSNGGDIFDSSWKPIFNNAKGVEATERYVGMLTKLGAAPPGSVTYNEYESGQSMVQGESAMFMSWWWQYTNLVDKEKAAAQVYENVGFTSVPAWEGRGAATYAICMPLSIMKDSRKIDAAYEFLKWATSADMDKAIVLDRSVPAQTTNVAVHVSTLKDPAVNEAWGGMHKAAADSLAVSRIMPQIPEWPQVSDALAIAVNRIATGAPAKATLDTAAAEVEAIMKRAGY
jgi:multiple sugar transport system substrate-binding protein